MSDTVYETTEDVLSTDYEDEAVIVHLESKRCFRLNDTAAEIWRGIAECLGRERMGIVAGWRRQRHSEL